MKPDELKNTIEDFLILVDAGSDSVQQNEKLLKLYLDRIALAATEIEVPFDYPEYIGSFSENEEDLRTLICSRFPNYGYYNIPDVISKEIANTDIIVGDGIDDLLDITKELRSVKMFWDKEGSQKALSAFLASYQYHLGDHLRELQYYLHALEKKR